MSDNIRPHVRPATSPSTPADQHSNSSLTSLVKQLANDVTSLFTKELALAKVEISHSVDSAKAGLVSMVTGGSVLFAGFLFILAAATFGLAQYMDLWLAALIVGGAVSLIGLIMVSAGKKKMSATSLTPTHTLESLDKDQRAIRRAI